MGCEKDNELVNQSRILGKWISVDKSDTLEFADKDNFYKSNSTMRHDHYDYTLYDDSIKIGYNGILYVLVLPTKHRYSLNGDQLTIDFSNRNCYGFGKQSITYIKGK
jgi:NAD+--asparagine ADP-ribosyltransferase